MKKKILGMVLTVAMAAALAGCGGKGDSAAKAQPDDKGNYLVNGSFEEADFTGWTVTNVDDVTEELDVYTRDTDCFEGVQSLHFYSGSSDVNFTAEQTVNGLEDGTYPG